MKDQGNYYCQYNKAKKGSVMKDFINAITHMYNKDKSMMEKYSAGICIYMIDFKLQKTAYSI